MQVLLSIRQLIARFAAWRAERRAPRATTVPLVIPPIAIHRDVSPSGIRVYSICGSCGARLDASATLCEECAQGRSRSAPPF